MDLAKFAVSHFPGPRTLVVDSDVTGEVCLLKVMTKYENVPVFEMRDGGTSP